jgi:hypothetical protein
VAIKKLLIPAVSSAAVLLAAPAHADTQFLDHMRDHGYADSKSDLSQGPQGCETVQSDTSESWSSDRLEHCLSIAESQLIATAVHP